MIQKQSDVIDQQTRTDNLNFRTRIERVEYEVDHVRNELRETQKINQVSQIIPPLKGDYSMHIAE
jgi:hypothetical protein